MLRISRKLDHVQYALAQAGVKKQDNGFEDLCLVHNALPELNCRDIDCGTVFMGKNLQAPLMINAITGGHHRLLEINKGLAGAAAATGIAMAVGSQQAALDDPSVSHSFAVVRETMPRGLLLANLSAGCSIQEARRAIAMVEADGLQLHLNVGQELAMPEGDTCFAGVLANIRSLAQNLPVPVLVKEVGFGLSKEAVTSLYEAGVRYVDVSGRGGTNFAAIEGSRGGRVCFGLENWGITTAVSLLEALSTDLPLAVVASGGMVAALDIALALAVGAKMVAVAGPYLKEVVENGPEGLEHYIRRQIDGLRQFMLLTGARNLTELACKPLVITGRTAQWLQRRGVDIDAYARR